MGQPALAQVLRRLPPLDHPRLLVGSSTADDAGVFRLDRDRALVQTVDFFTPIVDDPRRYGEIAAANALSDVYAMGGRPLTALNIVGVPEEALPPEVLAKILQGGQATATRAGCVVVGGHTIRSPEPFYGLAVTGLVHPRRIITNARGRPGDRLILTKPLGTGIATTGIKRQQASPALARAAVRTMRQLNEAGAVLAERGLVRAGTDVTGFGLLGHLGSLCRASGVGAELQAAAVPVLHREVWRLLADGCVPGGTRQNLEVAGAFTEFDSAVTPEQRLLLADAQTSGGLLLCVRPRHEDAVLALLRSARTVCAVVIGRLVRSPQPRILVLP
ncbi:MAG: selenide, water dikinase SelD [Verrucomicrobia bacterium]|nr:MAG: selenide, water dikinase SelD [Verrucomicrobiota bacterium]